MGTVVVTGAGGFLGQAVARRFSADGWSVFGVGRSLPTAEAMPHFAGYRRLDLPHGEWRELIRELRPELCVHCAGRASVPMSFVQPAEDFSAGPALTFDLLECLRTESPRTRFVYFSSAAVYGCPTALPMSETATTQPISPYGFHKRQSEQLCEEFSRCFGLATSALRIFSAYGRGLRRQVIWDVCRKLIDETEVKLQGTGSESRDFVHADDVALAVDAVQRRGAMQGECYNVATGCETTVGELVHLLSDHLATNRAATFTGDLPPGTPRRWRADVGKLRALGWSPTMSLRDGLADLVAWIREERAWLRNSA